MWVDLLAPQYPQSLSVKSPVPLREKVKFDYLEIAGGGERHNGLVRVDLKSLIL